MAKKMKSVAFKDATVEQLREFAANSKGISGTDVMNIDKVRATIKALDDKIMEIKVFDDVEDPFQALTPAQQVSASSLIMPMSHELEYDRMDTNSQFDPRVTIMIHKAGGEGGDRPVSVSVNGRNQQIPRGQPCVVAYRYFLDLQDAVKTEYEQAADGEMIGRDVPAYPFSVVKDADPEELKMFWAVQHARVLRPKRERVIERDA